MTTRSLAIEERRLVALTVALVRRGVLPAFYQAPRGQRRLERRLRGRLSSLLGLAASGLLDQLLQGNIDPANELQVGGVLSGDMANVSTGVQAAYLGAYLDGAKDAFQRQARRILDRAGIEISWDLVEPRAIQTLERISFQASDKLMEHITGDVKGVLLKGVEEGLGTWEIGDGLKDVIKDISERQAEGLARTEVNSAVNSGNFLAMEEAQVEYVQWLATQDARTRPSHMAQHGMVIRPGAERFPNSLRHPGDRDGTPIEEWALCRCAGVAYFPLRSELGKATPFVGRA